MSIEQKRKVMFRFSLRFWILNGNIRGERRAVNKPENRAGWVLTGGRSSRMGTDKALISLDGRPLALRVADAVAGEKGGAGNGRRWWATRRLFHRRDGSDHLSG